MESKHQQILDLAQRLREVAEPVGPIHGWWDLIADLEEFVEGRPTILHKTADEWIAYAEQTLAERRNRLAINGEKNR